MSSLRKIVLRGFLNTTAGSFSEVEIVPIFFQLNIMTHLKKVLPRFIKYLDANVAVNARTQRL